MFALRTPFLISAPLISSRIDIIEASLGHPFQKLTKHRFWTRSAQAADFNEFKHVDPLLGILNLPDIALTPPETSCKLRLREPSRFAHLNEGLNQEEPLGPRNIGE